MAGVMAGIAIMLIFSTVTFQAWQDEMARMADGFIRMVQVLAATETPLQ